MYFVVGSGPAGIACAQALAQRNCKTVVLDPGIRLEPARQSIKARLAASAPSEWSKSDLASLAGPPLKRKRHPATKLAYGSDFIYRAAAGSTNMVTRGAELVRSHAVAGLSNVWGGAVLPYRDRDTEDWPITTGELAPYYAAVLQWMPLASQHDDLEQFFPSFVQEHVSLPQSRQAQRVLQTLNRNRATLNANGVFFGPSRLAVDAQGSRSTMPCQACGHCLHGCPYDLIYSTNTTLRNMVAAGLIEHWPGMTVQRLEETGRDVRLQGISADGSPFQFHAERVFLGAGPLDTTTILLRSLGCYERTLEMKDLQLFRLPTIHLYHTPNVQTEHLHALCQLFIEIFDERLSPYTVHLQVYTYSKMFREELAKLGRLELLVPKSLLFGRLLLLQGYLHSYHSGRIGVTLRRGNNSEVIELVGAKNRAADLCVQELTSKLVKLTRSTGLLPLTPMLDMTPPGGSTHFGGTFPMADAPNELESDRLGRPAGLKRVHIVDATAFPSIPATTITFTVMANAYRIGTLASEQ